MAALCCLFESSPIFHLQNPLVNLTLINFYVLGNMLTVCIVVERFCDCLIASSSEGLRLTLGPRNMLIELTPKN